MAGSSGMLWQYFTNAACRLIFALHRGLSELQSNRLWVSLEPSTAALGIGAQHFPGLAALTTLTCAGCKHVTARTIELEVS